MAFCEIVCIRVLILECDILRSLKFIDGCSMGDATDVGLDYKGRECLLAEILEVGISILYLSYLRVIAMGENRSIQQVNLMNLMNKLGGWEKWVVSMGDVPSIQEHWGEGKLGICTLEGSIYMEETRMVECYFKVYC